MKTASSTPHGHTPTLVASFLHFDVSFMLWVLLGALGVFVAESAGLRPAEKGLMVALPILSGALIRLPLGLLSDQWGGKRVGTALLIFLFLPLTVGWLAGDALPNLLAVGLMLGTAGGSFAVALPLASRWYPSERQGLVMGIAAAGNSGTVLANLAAPSLASLVGWHNVMLLAMLPLAAVLVTFLLIAKDSPYRKARPMGLYLLAFRREDLWWFCLFYSVTFGGYVGLSSFLPLFLHDQYGVSPVTGGLITAAAALVGSGARPLGGYLADRLGGTRMLTLLLTAIGVVYLLGSLRLPIEAMVGLLLLGMACLGMGNGAVFQLVPQRFAKEIGVATGTIGAAGGLGGFLLPVLLGAFRQFSGSFAPGFLVLGSASLAALVLLRVLIARQRGWRLAWRGSAEFGGQEERASEPGLPGLSYYPVYLDLRSRLCAVIGTGPEAERKVQGLLDAGAQVVVVAPQPSPDLEAFAEQGQITLRRRRYQEGDLAGVFLAIAATTEEPELSRRVAAEGRREGALLNVMDVPPLCTWIAPAVIRRGALTVAVSTNGRSPAMARFVKERLDHELPEEYGPLLDLLGDVRNDLRRRRIRPRPEAWQEALDGEALRLAEAGQWDGVRERLLASLGQRSREPIGSRGAP